jgi:hypothetical protein
MSKAVPIIIIFVILIGGIVTWGAMTDWTFSGILPREGARCSPDTDEKDENATEYIYDVNEECVVVNKCKTGWEPNSSNTACENLNAGKECTVPVTTISNVDTYKYSPKGVCNLIKTCDTGWKPSSAATICEVDACTTPVTPISNAKLYDRDTAGTCTLVKECNTGFTVSADSKTCEADECTTPVTPISNAKLYDRDTAGTCTLVKECNTGFRVSDDSKTCVDEWVQPTTFKDYQMDGYFSVNTTTDGGEFPQGGTLENCRTLAVAKDALAFGVRSPEHPTAAYKKTCWYYGSTWVPDQTSTVVGEGSHYVECIDITKDPSKGCK